MPNYNFECLKSEKEFSLFLSIKEKEEGKVKCPSCGKDNVEHQITSFYVKTSRKS
jgi:putative FmdB family regulatory protein